MLHKAEIHLHFKFSENLPSGFREFFRDFFWIFCKILTSLAL